MSFIHVGRTVRTFEYTNVLKPNIEDRALKPRVQYKPFPNINL